MEVYLIIFALACQTKPFIELRPEKLSDEQATCIADKTRCYEKEKDFLKCLEKKAPCHRSGVLAWTC